MTIYVQTKLKTERLTAVKTEDPLKWLIDYSPNIIQRLQKVTQSEIEAVLHKHPNLNLSKDELIYYAQMERYKPNQAYFISGYIEPNENGTIKRNNESLIRRDLISLDYDNLAVSSDRFNEIVSKALNGYRFITYPTIKSTFERPRMRLIIQPDKPLLKFQYEFIVKEITEKINLPYDSASYVWSQTMGLPVITPKNNSTGLYVSVGDGLYPIPLDIEPPKPKVINSSRHAINNGQSIHHGEAIKVMQGYIERDGDNLNDYSNFISAASVLAKSVQDNIITYETASECVRLLAMGNQNWETDNIQKLNELILNESIRTPYNFLDKFNFKLKPKKSETLNDLLELLAFEGTNWRSEHEKVNDKTGEIKIQPVTPRATANIIKKVCHVCLIGEADPELSPLAIYNPDNGTYNKGERFIKRLCLAVEPTLTSAACDTVMHFLTVESNEKEPTQDRDLIVFNNGIYSRTKQELMNFSPEYVFVNKISTNYVENAQEPVFSDWSFSQWIDELSDDDPDKKTLFWQIIANTIDGNAISEIACFFYSEQGSTGKSTVQALLTNLVGKENVASLKIKEFEENFKLASAYGKSLIIGDDNSPKSFNETSENFKSVVSGDNVLIEAKREKPFLYYFRSMVIQSMNGLPKFNDVSDGLLRRLRVIKFNHSYKGNKKNRNIKEKYIKDPRLLEYIAFEALKYDSQDFIDTKESQDAIRGLALENNKVLQFFEEYVSNLESTRIPTKILFSMFRVWCRVELNSKDNMTRNTFTSEAKIYSSRSGWEYSSAMRVGSNLSRNDLDRYNRVSSYTDPHFELEEESEKNVSLFYKTS